LNALSGYAAQKKPAENHATIGNESNSRKQIAGDPQRVGELRIDARIAGVRCGEMKSGIVAKAEYYFMFLPRLGPRPYPLTTLYV
jgi:hypothetical protein